MIKLSLKKAILAVFGLVTGFVLSSVVHSATIINVTETHYDANLRPDCTVIRMNPATFGDAPSTACSPKTAGNYGPDRITKTAYDAAGQVTQIIQAYGTTDQRAYATFSYSNNGKVIDSIDANGNRSHNVYDGFDRLSGYYYPSTTKPSAYNPLTQVTALSTAGAYSTTDYEQYGYDANNNRLTVRRRDGQILTDCYDALNRLVVHYLHSQTGCTATGGIKDVYTAYDLQGRVLTKRFASTSGSGVSYAYNGLGQVTSSTDMNGRTVAYQYNAAGARSRLTYPDNNYVNYGLDNLSRLTSASWNATSALFSQTYDNLGRRATLSRGASGTGGASAYTYDNFGRLTAMTNDLDGTAYDITWTFSSYNPANQIMSRGASNAVYVYVETATNTNNRTFDGLNRDASIAAVTGGYDARGNLTSEGTASGSRTFNYDVDNRLLSAATVGGANLNLTYDPEGRLAAYTVGSTTTAFLYDGTNLIGEYDGSGAMLRRYMHGAGVDEPLVQFEGSSASYWYYFYTNYQGSIIATTNYYGVQASLTKYGPYGEPNDRNNAASWTGSRFKYTGQTMLPEAKLYYYKARVYDPNYGRFLQTDPVGGDDDLDLYAYVGGDPINSTDPTGATCVPCMGRALALAGSRGGKSAIVALFDGPEPGPADAVAVGGLILTGGALIYDIGAAILTNDDQAQGAPPGTADSDKGCIYCVPGDKTKSGKPYVGSADDLDKRAKGARDGRDRNGADVIGEYDKGDRKGRQDAEQKGMNDKGGKGKLDNDRNEVDPKKWKDRGIEPPQG